MLNHVQYNTANCFYVRTLVIVKKSFCTFICTFTVFLSEISSVIKSSLAIS